MIALMASVSVCQLMILLNAKINVVTTISIRETKLIFFTIYYYSSFYWEYKNYVLGKIRRSLGTG